ncbi:peptidase M16 family protein [Paraliomyxa miuraensis]|uniref:hypothetical protein n=1 Tax=Paraliomyxa miuraensis TaxID=376150 RepID=UPI002251D791|nr:hypothetical protein [Paraliomyxa miuraensis]MCX4243502.1 hypothetical protein [Paraliomyxa miuraensis]
MLPRPRALRRPLSGSGRSRVRLALLGWRGPWACVCVALLGLGLGLGHGRAVLADMEDEPPAEALEPAGPDDPTEGPDAANEANGANEDHGDDGATDDGQDTAGDGGSLDGGSLDEAALPGPRLQDGVLPCGLRVIVAQDASLPVAAVVLAIETGTEDDPPSQAGLVHALAYHLLQGNRELRPAGAAAMVHDQGGITSLAVGPAQVRFETLAPISALDDVLWIESQRLRAPTVSAELWGSTLRWARRDGSRAWRAPRAAMAAAHGVPELEHDGRVVTPALEAMVPRAIGQALADRFRYEQATLIVVSPHRPPKLRERIEALFADLPAQPRRVRDRSPRWRTGTVPQALEIPGEAGGRFVWPVAPDPASLAQATVWCKALNRQRRLPGEPARARLRCHLDVDPRRATLVLHATGVDDPKALVQARTERLERGEDDVLVERQREGLRRAWSQELRSALPLAQRLAWTSPGAADPESSAPGWRARPVSALTGLAQLSVSWRGRGFGAHLQPGAAVVLVPAPKEPAPKEPAPKEPAQ